MANQTVSVKVNVEGKNTIIAYLLWWFLGWAGVHRFYLGRTKSGIAQLLLFVLGWATAVIFIGYLMLLIWCIWWMLDAFFTYKMVEEENSKLGIEYSTFSLSKTDDSDNKIDQLEKLHALYEKGALTKEQYEQRKDDLLR